MAEREEIVGSKRIVREHDADGKLLRIRILTYAPPPADAPPKPVPVSLRFGQKKEAPAGDSLPPQDAAPAPEPARAPPRPPESDAATAPSPVPAGDIPPAREAAVAAVPVPAGGIPPARKAPVIHVRFRHEPDQAGIDVVVSPFHEPKAPRPLPALPSVRVDAPPPVRGIHVRFADEVSDGDIDVLVVPLPEQPPPELPIGAKRPKPAPVVSREPEPIVAAEREPVAPVEAAPVELKRESEPDPEPQPTVAPAPVDPEPELVRYRPPPRFEIVALERVVAPKEPEPEPVPEPAKVAPPEPEPVNDEVVEIAPVVRGPPDAYLPYVPDVDTRVDALLAREDAPAKRRKRAPIPAPAFEPLQREPWEDRLDAALAGR